ncbi:MAG: hypothetical protein NT145_04930 [Elusimicrobia bacterium]|nr:hypothetical protein [Elusimicrobiota bacterium]
MRKLVAVFLMLTLIAPLSFAKMGKAKKSQAEQMYGLGFNTQTGISAVSLRYWKKGEIGFEGMLGYYSYDNSTNGSLVGGKLLMPIKDEKNLTCYWFGMLGLRNQSVAGASASGTFIGAGVGVEFFFEELPNLGFGAEIGLANTGGDAYTGTKGTALFSGSIDSVGIRYYFK